MTPARPGFEGAFTVAMASLPAFPVSILLGHFIMRVTGKCHLFCKMIVS